MLQTVLDSTKCGTLGGYLLDCSLNGIDSAQRICIICTVYLDTFDAKSSCIHSFDFQTNLVVAGRISANMQIQAECALTCLRFADEFTQRIVFL